MVKLLTFDGGVNKRLDPSLLNPNAAVELKNTKIDSGILEPVKDKEFYSAGSGNAYAYDIDGTIYKSNNQFSIVKHNDTHYKTEEGGVIPSYWDDDSNEFVSLGVDVLDNSDITIRSVSANNSTFVQAQFQNVYGGTPYICHYEEFRIFIVVHELNNVNNIYALLDRIDINLTRHPTNFTVSQYFRVSYTGSLSAHYPSGAEVSALFSAVEQDTYRWVDVRRCKRIGSGDNPKFFRYTYIDFDDDISQTFSPNSITFYFTAYKSTNPTVESVPISKVHNLRLSNFDAYSDDLGTNFFRFETNVPTPVSPSPMYNKIRVYMQSSATVGDPKLIKELDLVETTDYVNEIGYNPAELGESDFPSLLGNFQPDVNIRYLTVAYSTLFGAIGTEIRFSRVNEPHEWPPENSFDIYNTITGLLVINQGILIFTEDKTYLLTGNSTSNFALNLISDDQGCINGYSCQLLRNRPLWISKDGLCTLYNNYVQILSKPFFGLLNLDYVTDTIVYDEQYFIAGGVSNLVFDFRYELRAFYYEGETQSFFISNDNELCLIDSGSNYDCFKAFESSNNTSMRYDSPVLIEGNPMMHKMYNKVYVRYEGYITITMFIDGLVVYNKVLSSTSQTTHEFSPPAEKQRGYNCQFRIIGTGKVYGIETMPTGRGA